MSFKSSLVSLMKKCMPSLTFLVDLVIHLFKWNVTVNLAYLSFHEHSKYSQARIHHSVVCLISSLVRSNWWLFIVSAISKRTTEPSAQFCSIPHGILMAMFARLQMKLKSHL